MLKEHKINEKITWYEAEEPNQAEQDRSSLQVTNPIEMTIRGQDLNDANSVKGLPKQVTIDSNDIEEAMHATLNTIVRSAKEILGEIQPGLAGDIIDRS